MMIKKLFKINLCQTKNAIYTFSFFKHHCNHQILLCPVSGNTKCEDIFFPKKSVGP